MRLTIKIGSVSELKKMVDLISGKKKIDLNEIMEVLDNENIKYVTEPTTDNNDHIHLEFGPIL